MSVEKQRGDSRLEAFSDAVFAFALTLLVVSLEVPRSYADLMRMLKGFLPFACCFAVLAWIWFEHRNFFRHYPLQDPVTVALNCALLFVVMFYVYPLKFIFESWFARFGSASREMIPMTLPQLAYTSAIYGGGFALLFAMFALLYCRAWQQRSQLALSPAETFEAWAAIGRHLVNAGGGMAVVLVALVIPRRYAYVGPMSFMLLGPAHAIYGSWVERRRARHLELPN